MTLRQQIISDRVEHFDATLNLSDSESFERLIHSLVTGESVYSLDTTDCVNGSQDKQIDLISIDEREDEAELFIISAKFTGGFSSNAIILMKNGLNWIFNRSRAEIDTITNVAFRDKILDIRSVQSGIGPSNITVRCYFATNGLSSEISQEYEQEVKGILNDYDNGTFADFTFESLGADELVGLMNRIERRNRTVDADISIRYDANSPSLIKYHSQGLQGLICTSNARELAELVNRDTSGALFDSNIRRFLGKGKSVNADILSTATNASSSYLFWFLNNGVTIICDSADAVTDPDKPIVKIKNLQIVNGCQTATALAHAEHDGNLRPDTRVLLKIYVTTEPTLASRIVLTTNNQNRISNRDLKANDDVQQDMQRGFDNYNLLYEHKINQYAASAIPTGKRVVSNDFVGQAYLAIALKKPGDARRRKYKIWADYYKDIFSGRRVEPHVLCLLICESAVNWAKEARGVSGIGELRRKLINNGIFHIARIAAYLWRGEEGFSQDVEAHIELLQTTPSIMNQHFDSALNILEKTINDNPAFRNDVDVAIKASLLETTITQVLHASNEPANDE